MRRVQFFAEIRRLIGNVSQNDVPNPELESDLRTALEWLADELGIFEIEDTLSLALVAGKQNYPVTPEVSSILWLRYGSVVGPLKATTTLEWDAESWDWKRATAGQPLEYAFEGREIIFDRAVDATTLASYPRATFKYRSSSPGISPAGVLRLPEADARLAITYAAMRWCMARPDKDGVNQRRVENYRSLLAMDLPRAKARHGQTIRSTAPKRRVRTGRQGANR